jgi:UDP-N-acetylglucosamine 2-epimerase (non-hydrolysing)
VEGHAVKKQVVVYFGTRPELIKLAPVIHKLQADDTLDVNVVCSWQHPGEMLKPLCEWFEITPRGRGHSQISMDGFIGTALLNLTNTIQCADCIVVQGDTNSALVGAQSGFLNKVPVVHVEAGLRTYDRWSPYPEEVNRQVITKLATYHCAPTEDVHWSLQDEMPDDGYLEQTGNTVVDAVHWSWNKLTGGLELNNAKDSLIQEYKQRFMFFQKQPDAARVLVTAHRRENRDHLMDLIYKVSALATVYGDRLQFVWPVHPNPAVKDLVREYLVGIDNIYLLDPLAYQDMLYVMSCCELIITDSGGIQEEAPSFGVPVIVTREHTERVEALESGCAKLIEYGDAFDDKMSKLFTTLVEEPTFIPAWRNKIFEHGNPFGDGHAADKILEVIKEACG